MTITKPTQPKPGTPMPGKNATEVPPKKPLPGKPTDNDKQTPAPASDDDEYDDKN